LVAARAAAVVFTLVAFVDNRQASSSVDPAASAKMEQQTKNALDSFRKKLEEQKKKLAEEKGLKAADEMFKQIEEGTRELTQKEKLDPSKRTSNSTTWPRSSNKSDNSLAAIKSSRNNCKK